MLKHETDRRIDGEDQKNGVRRERFVGQLLGSVARADPAQDHPAQEREHEEAKQQRSHEDTYAAQADRAANLYRRAHSRVARAKERDRELGAQQRDDREDQYERADRTDATHQEKVEQDRCGSILDNPKARRLLPRELRAERELHDGQRDIRREIPQYNRGLSRTVLGRNENHRQHRRPVVAPEYENHLDRADLVIAGGEEPSGRHGQCVRSSCGEVDGGRMPWARQV